MATLVRIKEKIQRLIDSANAVTGNADTDLTSAVNELKAGYAQSGSYDSLRLVTFMGADCETVESTISIAPTYECPESSVPKMTKESTVDKVFTHVGWSLTPDGEADSSVLDNIKRNITLYPVFEESVRYYTVRFWDGDSLRRTEQVPCGGSSDWTYEKTGAYFQGWMPEPTNVMADMDCYGVWEYASFATDTIAQISEHAVAGVADEYYSVGDERIYEMKNGNTVVLRIADINGTENINGNSEKGISVLAVTPLPDSLMAYGTDITNRNFAFSAVNEYLNTVFNDILPNELSTKIRPAMKKYNGNVTGTDVAMEGLLYLWIPSKKEVDGTLVGDIRIGGYPLFTKDLSGEDDLKNRRVMKLRNGELVSYWLIDITGIYTAAIVCEDGTISEANVNSEQAYIVFGFCL